MVLTRAPRATGTSYDEDAPAVRQLRLLTWGLVPSWAKDVKVGLRMINARAESVLEKPAFAKAAAVPPGAGAGRRLVRVAGQPHRHRRQGQAAQAAVLHPPQRRVDRWRWPALYEFWRDRSVEDKDDPRAWLTTYTIITTEAEPGLDRIHDRQPLVLEREDWADWLDPRPDRPGRRPRAPGVQPSRPVRRLPDQHARSTPRATTARACSSRWGGTTWPASSTR